MLERSQGMTDTRIRGFTVIELLIVIAIIAVLAAILFPVFARAKESALQTAALSQMKQLGTAFSLYTDDHDGKLLPSTNYGLPEAAPERLWTNNLFALAKDKNLFVAPGSNGEFADTWDKRGGMTIGYNSSTAVDRQRGCAEGAADVSGCVAFKTVAEFSKSDPSTMALFAITPGGSVENKYLGYEFSPYNGVPTRDEAPLNPPLVSDRDLVAELGAVLPAELIKPILARYHATGRDQGSTPIVFGDGHVKSFSAQEIMSSNATTVWRLR
jgi:prepilin-type N-terminal cleavage/methylation domain-containing protein